MLITTLVVSFCRDRRVSVNVKLWFFVVYVRCEGLCRSVLLDKVFLCVPINLNSCDLLCVVIVVFRCVCGDARHHPHRTHDLRSGSQDHHHQSKNSVQNTICCNSTSNAPDDGRMYPKYFELRIHQ